MCGPVAQWIRHLTTNQGILGSNPGGVDSFFYEKTKTIFAKKIKFNILKRKNRMIWRSLTNQYVKDSFCFSELRLGRKPAHKHKGKKSTGGFKGKEEGLKKRNYCKGKKRIVSQKNQI